jgi:DNA (cytosine-5)-methyltransferase 1
MMEFKYTAGALFSGIGGFCLGFEPAGIKTKWAIESDQYAAKTYSHNLKDVRIIVEDIRSVDVLAKSIEPVDVLTAGFPCQSFSQAGERKGFEDPRGKLFYEVIRIIKELKDKKPAIIVLENAPYLRSGDGGGWFIQVSKEIKKAGYWFRDSNCVELDTFDFTNLPQRRKRLFMVGLSTEIFSNGKFNFPTQKNTSEKQLKNFIAFDGSLEDDTYYLNDENKYYKMITEKTEDKYCIYQLRKFLVRVKSPDECPTLTANMGLGGHNVPFIHDSKGLRKLTEYECLRLQGFPAGFTFPDDVPKARRYVQIGNSVSVPIANLLAKGVVEKFKTENYP